MAYVLDALLILIVVVTVAWGYRRGFIRSVIQLAGLVAAFVLAASLSTSLSTWTYDTFLSEPLTETVMSVLEENKGTSASEQLDTVLEKLPTFLSNAINQNDQATKAIEQLQTKVEDSAEVLAKSLVQNVVRPLAVSLLRFLWFILLVIVLMIAVKLLTKLLKPVTKLPLIRQADGLLGAAVGLVKAVLFVFIAVSVMQLLASSGKLITAEQLENSAIASFVAEHNPVCGQLEFI